MGGIFDLGYWRHDPLAWFLTYFRNYPISWYYHFRYLIKVKDPWGRKHEDPLIVDEMYFWTQSRRKGGKGR